MTPVNTTPLLKSLRPAQALTLCAAILYCQPALAQSATGSATPANQNPPEAATERATDGENRAATQQELEAVESPDVETVQVIGKRQADYTIITEDAQKLVEMPGSLGDPLGAISALPGVISPASGGPPAVRGSSPADNRYFIDGMPAGYIFHAFNTSIFDENVVQDFQLYSAGFGAQYSDATGAVFDIRLRDPANQELLTTVSASLLRAGVMIESGVTDNSAFYLSARKGLIEFFYPEEDEPNEDGIRVESPPSDSDYVAKYVWAPDDGRRLAVNLVGARDEAEAEFDDRSELAGDNPDFAGDAGIKDSFDSQAIQWQQPLGERTLVNLQLAHYKDNSSLFWGEGYYSDMIFDDLSFKGELQFDLQKHTIILGTELSRAEFTYDTRSVLFVCTEFDPDCSTDRREVVEDERSIDINTDTLFAIDRWQMTETLLLETGLQWTTNDYNNNDFFNPRIALYWQMRPTLRLKTSAGRYNRFPDMEAVLPVIGNPALDSPRSDHYTLGFEGDIFNHWTWSIEGYHKTFDDLPLALGQSEPDAENLYSNDTTGTAQGVDLFLNRNYANNWYGWIALSYSESDRTNERSGQTSVYRFDTPWVLNVVANYQFTSLWSAGFRLTAKSGEPTTEITGIRPNPSFPDYYLPVYGDPYAERLPTYAQLDLRVERTIQWFGNDGSFYIDVINATNRQNVTDVGLDYERVNQTGQLYLEKDTGLGVFGSVGVTFSF